MWKHPPLADRLAALSIPEPNSGCWLWIGALMRGRLYGKVYVDGKLRAAHRAAWAVWNGPIPSGMAVCHRCDTPSCINPAHLFLGTQQDNIADMFAKGRARHNRGERHHNAKLTNAQALRAFRDCRGLTEIAKMYGVGATTIARLKTGETYSSVTGAEKREKGTTRVYKRRAA